MYKGEGVGDSGEKKPSPPLNRGMNEKKTIFEFSELKWNANAGSL